MKIRSALVAVIAGLVCVGQTFAKEAARYPIKAIELVVAAPPGGQSDILGRLVADELSKRLGQSVVVLNKPGGSGITGFDYAARAKPDGYTLLVANSGILAILPNMVGNLPFNPATDFVPITEVAGGASVLLVNPDVPAKTLDELVTYSKAKPNGLKFGIGGFGTIHHIIDAQLQKQTGAKWEHVAYNGGGQTLVGLVAGQVDVSIENASAAAGYLAGGRLRALAVSYETSVLPEVPTFASLGLPDIKGLAWHGIVAPRGTPQDVIDKVDAALIASLASPEFVEKLKTVGLDPIGISKQDFADFIKSETLKAKSIVDATGIKFNQ